MQTRRYTSVYTAISTFRRLSGASLPMASPAVSVIVPVFNREAFVAQAVASLAEQILADIEIIDVDDGSSDASAEVAERAGGFRGTRPTTTEEFSAPA
jgi:cellulose synthase/poly-beta-1,6-N-acetylglucosamine synthase-like glycosyltransferase